MRWGKEASAAGALILAGCLANQGDYQDARQRAMDRDDDGFAAEQYVDDFEGPDQADCDDQDPDVHPAASEVPYDGVDNDCSADTPDDDLDWDGALADTDCDDGDPERFPGNDEIWYDGVDQDCDGNDRDQDGDGFDLDQECDDTRADIFPDAEEVCDLVDNDCDDDVDEYVDTWWVDADGDGFGSDAIGPTMSCTPDEGAVYEAGDCDDEDAAVSPEAVEVCNDLTDNDCDGTSGDCAVTGEVWLGDQATHLAGVHPGDLFSAGLVVADVSRDGQDDLVVGAPLLVLDAVGTGGVWVLEGPVEGPLLLDDAFWSVSTGVEGETGEFLSVMEDIESTLLLISTAKTDQLNIYDVSGGGSSPVATLLGVPDGLSSEADLDSDNRADLVVSGGRFGVQAGETGAVLVYLAPLAGSLDASDAEAQLTTSDQDELFGEQTHAVDYDGDGISELFVSAPDSSVVASGAGRVYRFTSPLEASSNEDADCAWDGFEAEMGLGTRFSSGDLDADGYNDLVIGAPRHSAGGLSESGSVILAPGTPNPNDTTMATSGIVFTSDQIEALFGADVEASADLNGDGAADLVIGAPGVEFESSAYSGAVAVFDGPIADGLTLQDATLLVLAAEGGGMVGYSLATGHLDADPLDDVAIGSSYYFTESGTGAVTVLMGAGF